VKFVALLAAWAVLHILLLLPGEALPPRALDAPLVRPFTRFEVPIMSCPSVSGDDHPPTVTPETPR
jgi:hypothetical protein